MQKVTAPKCDSLRATQAVIPARSVTIPVTSEPFVALIMYGANSRPGGGAEQMTSTDRGLDTAWWSLRLGLGLGPFLAGLDKFFNILADWQMYLSPLAERWLPVSGTVFMQAVGLIEMAVGVMILTRWTRAGAYVASAWLVAIAVNLLSTGMFFDLAVRDVEIAIAAYTLARLSEARAAALAGRGSERSDMKKSLPARAALASVVLLAAMAVASAAPETAAETWKNVSLIDSQCATKVKDDPDAHTTRCALQCVKNGYGILASDGTFLPFDAAGNKQAEVALKATRKEDHLRATVTGKRQGNVIIVSHLSLD